MIFVFKSLVGTRNSHFLALCNSSTAVSASTVNPSETVEQFSTGLEVEVCFCLQQNARRGPWGFAGAFWCNVNGNLGSIKAKFRFTVKPIPYTSFFVYIQTPDRPSIGAVTRILCVFDLIC